MRLAWPKFHRRLRSKVSISGNFWVIILHNLAELKPPFPRTRTTGRRNKPARVANDRGGWQYLHSVPCSQGYTGAEGQMASSRTGLIFAACARNERTFEVKMVLRPRFGGVERSKLSWFFNNPLEKLCTVAQCRTQVGVLAFKPLRHTHKKKTAVEYEKLAHR